MKLVEVAKGQARNFSSSQIEGMDWQLADNLYRLLDCWRVAADSVPGMM